ncbi:MAG TPA: helix-turn-helix domain-containing protein [Trueperaceae bacterium]|nr:helix-turn-helix domain-containing protein [Trueperaceae bacterium]
MSTSTPAGSPPRAAAALGRLLERSELDLELRTGDPETVFTAVRHADRPDDRPWLRAGDLRLSEAAFSLPRPTSDPLFEPPPAALVYVLNPRRRSVPETLVKRCAAAGVALLIAPPATSPELIEEAALGALLTAAPAGLDLLSSVQRYLLGALDGPKPERDVLDRVNRLSGISLALLTPWGETVARVGPKVSRISHLEVQSLPEGSMRLKSSPALLTKITARGRPRGVLMAFDVDDSSLPWLELSRGLLIAAALQRSAEAQQDRSRKGALLAEWLAGPQAANMLLPRLRDAGLDVDNDYVVAVAEVGPKAKPGKIAAARGQLLLERLREAADEYFLAAGHGSLSETRAEHDVWVYAAGAPRAQAEPLLRALKAAAADDAGSPTPVRLGLSLPRRDLSGVADAYHQAVLALQAVPGADGLAWFDQFDPVYWVLRQQPAGNLMTLRDRLVGPVKAADDGKLWRTLSAYLRSPSDLTALARELHIHVNTLRYRLKRIEALIEAPLDRPETVAKLYLAQQIDAMLERDEGGGVAG